MATIASNDGVGIEADKDMFTEDVSSVFPFPYHLQHEKAVGLDKTYILHVSSNVTQSDLAVALSNNNVALYDSSTLSEKRAFSKAHSNTITGLHFSKKEPSIFYTSSLDECVKMWDSREDATAPVRTFTDTSRDNNGARGKKKKQQGGPAKPLTSFDVNCSDRLLCAGTEQVIKDSFLLFWDVRKSSLVGGYWDSHEDDVTAVSFHPEKEDRLATSGTDGIVNVFDVGQPNEDEALETCVNTESSVQKLTWFHDRKGNHNSLACVTHTEELHLWNVDDTGPYHVFSREDACVGMKRKVTESAYLVDVFERELPGGGGGDDRQLMVMAASSCADNPCLRLTQVRKNRLRPHSDFGIRAASGGSETVRCLAHFRESEAIVTGGEDGVLRLWKTGAETAKKEKVGLKAQQQQQKGKKKSNPY